MEQTATYTRRTREEIIAWWLRAKERKEAFQRETDEWWQARQKGLKEDVQGQQSTTNTTTC